MIVAPRELLVRLAQDWRSGEPVRCRCCCEPWPRHASGCPVSECLMALYAVEELLATSTITIEERP